MDYKSIQELIKTMSDSTLTFLEIETEGIQIKMGKEIKKVSPEPQEKNIENTADERNFVQAQTQVAKGSTPQENREQSVKTMAVAEAEDIHIVTSPIVGTFYSASGPEVEDFVSIGKRIKKGDPLCIIEAMKLMNEIEAEVEGEIIEILVENEQMVEYGQPLFKIKK